MKPLKRPRPHPEMIEGPEAFNRFQEAMKAVLKVKKSDLPPSPFGKASHMTSDPVRAK